MFETYAIYCLKRRWVDINQNLYLLIMETTISKPVNLFLEFLRKTAKEAPAKILITLAVLFIYYFVPLILLLKWHLMLSLMLIAPVFVCAAVFLTQPATTSGQLEEKQDHNSMRYLVAATIISQISVMIEWALGDNHVFVWNFSTITGAALMFCGLSLRVRTIMELGKYFDNSVRILTDHILIKTGPYSVVRHGSYSGIYILALGIAVYFSAWWGLGISVVVLGLAYHYQIEHEEKALLAAFGDDYKKYCEKTYRMFPWIW